MISFHELHNRFIEAPKLETSTDINGLINTAKALFVLQHPNFPTVYYTRLYLGMVWCIDVVTIIKNALEPHQSNITTQLSAGHGRPETSPTVPSSGPWLSGKSSSSSQQPAIAAGFGSSQPKPKFPSGKTTMQSESMNTNWALKRTAGTFTFDGTPSKAKQTRQGSVNGTAFKNIPHDDVIASASTASVASHKQTDLQFFGDHSRPLSDQDPTTQNPIDIPPVALSENAINFDADIFNNFLSFNPAMTEAWESDLNDPMVLDGFHVSS